MKIAVGYTLIIVISGLLAKYQPSIIPWKEQLVVYKNIQDISIFLFGVMGVWLGIIYPKSLKDIFKIQRDSPSNLKNLKAIFLPIRNATMLVIISVLVQWLSPYLKRIIFIQINRELLLTLSFGVLSFSCLSLIWSLLLTLLPLEDSEAKVENAENLTDAVKDILGDR